MNKTEKEINRRRKRQRNEKAISEKNLFSAKVVRAIKPQIFLNNRSEVIAIIDRNVHIKRKNWRKYLPLENYDKNFIKITHSNK